MQIFYTFIISIFFSGLFFYIINWVIVPWNSENVLDVKNLIVFTSLFIAAFSSIFSVFHQIIDKLFFKKFYEKPDFLKALRRGILLGIILMANVWLKLFGLYEWHIVVLACLLIVLFEGFFLSLERKESMPNKDEQMKKREKMSEIENS